MVLSCAAECGIISEMTTSTKNPGGLAPQLFFKKAFLLLITTYLLILSKERYSLHLGEDAIYKYPQVFSSQPLWSLCLTARAIPDTGQGELYNPELPLATGRTAALGGRHLPGHGNERMSRPAQESPARLRNTAGWHECTQGVPLASQPLAPRLQMATGPQGVTGSWWQQHV